MFFFVKQISFRDCPVPIPEPELTFNPPSDLPSSKVATRQKLKSVFRDFDKQLHNDHLYTLPPGGEIRERLDAALERVACLEKEVKSLEQSKKRLSHVIKSHLFDLDATSNPESFIELQSDRKRSQ
jgi:hypothetical protein